MWTPEQHDALRVLADVYLQEDLPERAILVLEALQQEMPVHPPALGALCYAYLRAGRHQDALRASDDYLASLRVPGAESAPIWLMRSRAAWALGSSDEALHCFARYRQLSGEAVGQISSEDKAP